MQPTEQSPCPPPTADEPQRLAALRRYGILDTPTERAFDDIARLVAHVCQTPIAAINFIDERRQWFKSEVGLGVRETPLDVSICAHAILQRDVFVVHDTTRDERFRNNPLVAGQPHLRFYAGALLETPDGHALGTLCVLDYRPRDLTDAQKEALRALARQVMDQLELRRALEEQRCAEIEARQSEARLAAMLEASLDCIVGMDHQGRVTEWNAAAERTFGYTRAEALGREMADLIIPPAMRDAHRGGLARYLATGEGPVLGRRLELTAVRKDGGEFPVELAITPIRSDGPPAFTAHLRDITDAKRLAEARRMSEERFRRLVEQSPLSTQIFAPDGTTREVNRAWERLWGVKLSDLPGYNILNDQQLAGHGVMPLIQRAFAGEAAAIPPIPYVLDRGERAGQVRWCGAFAYPVKDDAGRVEEVVLVHDDVTERRQAQDALRQSEERLRSLIAQSAAGIAQTDLTGRIQFANDRFCQIVGYGRDEVLGLRVHDLTHPDDLADTTRRVAHGAASGDEYAMEKRYIRKDGSVVWVSVSASIIKDAAGSPQSIMGVVVDISDRKRAEAEIARARAEAEQNLARWRAVIESMTEGLVLADAQGNLLTMNPAALAVHGFNSVEEMLRRLADYPDLFELRDDRGRVLPLEQWPISRVLRGERFSGYEVEVHRRDTGSRWIGSYGGTSVRDASGSVVLAVLTLRDVTEQKRAEEALREGGAQARRIIDNTVAFVGVMTPDGTLTEANATALRAGGLRREDVIGRKFWDCYWWSYDADVQAQLRDAVARAASGEVVRYDVIVRMAGDTRMPIDFMLSPVKDDHGRITHLIPSGVDIAERKRAEADLRESEELVRTIAENSTQGMAMMDARGYCTYANRAWLDMTGYSAEEIRSAPLHDLVHHHYPDGRPFPKQECPIDRALPENFDVRAHEDLFFRKDGSTFPVLVAASPIFEHGRPVSTVIEVRDVTEAKRAEAEREQLLRAEREARVEAERASRMKDEFLATLSHELRTPLNAILGWATILKGDSRGTEDLAEGLNIIERNARAQTQIIEDLLDMSRIVSGKVRLDVQRLALEPVLRAAVEAIKPAAEAKGIRVQAVLDPLAGPISGDPNRLQQVFWNLLTNSLKFTPRGGRVQVLLERVNSHLEVSVIDTGEGISAEFLPHVFDRFRQADASTTRHHGGLGLGLSIVKQLVELHGGTVRVKSAGRGHGATFTVSLPLTVVHPEPEEGTDRRHPRVSALPVSVPEGCVQVEGVKVLVVDDEPDARALIKRLLEDCNARVTIAGSAAEALKLLGAEPPDVLVSDIGMPGEDGYSLIRRVRALGPNAGGNVPAIALTAYARAEDRVKAVVAGFDMHVAKPVEPAELVAMVASLAARRSA